MMWATRFGVSAQSSSGPALPAQHPVRSRPRRTRIGAAILLLGLIACTGCSSLPSLVPDLSLPRRSALPVQGARGPLTAAQSKAVLDRLASRGPETNIFDRHLALEQAIVGSPLTTGNQVQLLQDGPATYRAMLAAISAARDHINMETYILEDDAVGQRFAQALIDKQRQGVQVNLMVDSVGTLGTPQAFFQRLIDAGVAVLEFNPVNPLAARRDWALNQRDHRKLLVIDGRIAFLGGINISSVYSGGSSKGASGRGALDKPGKTVAAGVRVTPAASARPATQETPVTPNTPDTPTATADASLAWRDTDLQVQGPVVAEFQKLFLAAWAQQQGPALAQRAYFPPPEVAGRQVVRAIGSSPEEAFSLIYATLLSAIGSAETSVHLTNAYFAPDPQLIAALQAAARRGVQVKLILPSTTDSSLVFHAGRSHYTELLRAGVQIFERRGVILHAKTALIDGVWATVGSTNLDWRSFLHNHELNAVVLGTEFGAQVQAMFDRDLAGSDAVLLPAWEQRSPALRLREYWARAWAYWL